MKLSTKLFAGFVIILFFFTAVAVVNFRLSEDVLENSNWVARSQEVVRTSSSLQRNIIDMETGMRGFLLTGNEVFLDPYRLAARQIPALLNELERMVENSPVQKRQIEQIRKIHERWYK